MDQRVRASCFAAFQAGWSLAGGSEQWSGYFSVAAFRSRFAFKSQASHNAKLSKCFLANPKSPLRVLYRYTSLCCLHSHTILMLPNPFCWSVRQCVSGQTPAKCSTATSGNPSGNYCSSWILTVLWRQQYCGNQNPRRHFQTEDKSKIIET